MSTTLLSAFYDIDFLCKVGRSVVPQARPGLPVSRCARQRPRLLRSGTDPSRMGGLRPPGTGCAPPDSWSG